MPRKIRLAFQLAPLNSSPVATRIVYMRITFFYTHVTSLYPDAGAAYEACSKFRLGARDHEREAQREKEREREKRTNLGNFCMLDRSHRGICMPPSLARTGVGELTALQLGWRERRETWTCNETKFCTNYSRESGNEGGERGRHGRWSSPVLYEPSSFLEIDFSWQLRHGLPHVFSRLSRRKVSFMSRSRWISRKGCKSNNENVRTCLCWYTAIICTYVLPVKSQFESCAVSRARKIYENSSRNFLIQTKLTSLSLSLSPSLNILFYALRRERKKGIVSKIVLNRSFLSLFIPFKRNKNCEWSTGVEGFHMKSSNRPIFLRVWTRKWGEKGKKEGGGRWLRDI